MKCWLAFDLGASSGRAVLGRIRDGKLEMEEIHRFKNYPYEKDGHFYWDFQSLVKEIKEGIRKAWVKEQEIVSLSVDTWGVDYVIFRNGKPVRDPYCYRDSRTVAAMEHFHREIMSEDELYAHAGTQLMSFNTIYQLYAHQSEHPEDFANGSFGALMPDALLYALTEDHSATEYTFASTTSLLNAEMKQWDGELFRKIGVREDFFAPVEMPGKRVFRLSEAVAKELGVPRLNVVRTASHDTASAVIAAPVDPGWSWAYISSGTWALLGTELGVPRLDSRDRKAHFTNEGGANGKIRFLSNIMGTWLLQETRRTWNEQGKNISFDELEQMAQSVPDRDFRFNPDDEVFLAPGDMPARIRTWFHDHYLAAPETDAELVRCIYDSLATCFRDKIRIMEFCTGRRVGRLHILGGAIRDNFLMKLTAEACGIPVFTGPVEATATGNLITQMVGCGELHDFEDGRKLVRESIEVGQY